MTVHNPDAERHRIIAVMPCPECHGPGRREFPDVFEPCEECAWKGYVGVCEDGYIHALMWETSDDLA